MTMGPHELLWADPDVYHRRREKSALALIAVARALAARPSLAPGSDEFLRLYQWVSTAEPDHFTEVWCDPVAYFWVRRAMHFLASCRGEPLGTVERAYCDEIGAKSAAEALAHHLDEFKRFAVALALVSGRDLALERPYDTSLPLALPGTDLVIAGAERARITGVSNRALETSDDVRIEHCPVVRIDGASVYLNAARFRVPGIGFPTDWAVLPLDFQARHRDSVGDALRIIRRFQPATFRHMEGALHTIGLRPNDGKPFNISASELPGSFVCTMPSEPFALAATFIHEFHHNTLFGIEEAGAFFRHGDRDEIEGENHYSPWVETPRPLHGILHAVYVFLPVFRFWKAVASERSRDAGIGDAQRAFARVQIAMIPAQLRIGTNQLRRHAHFTSFGAMLFEELAAEVADAEDTSRGMGATLATAAMGVSPSGALRPVIQDGKPLSVADLLLDHLRHGDIHHECDAERSSLERALDA